MKRERIFLDADDVIFDLAGALKLATGDKSVSGLYNRVSWDNRVVIEITSNYEQIPLIRDVIFGVNFLNRNFDLVIVSECNSQEEARSKERRIKKLFPSIKKRVFLNRSLGRKWDFDMSDGILIDDNPEVLEKSNAGKKILFKNEVYSSQNDRYKGCKVNNWVDLVKLLLEGTDIC